MYVCGSTWIKGSFHVISFHFIYQINWKWHKIHFFRDKHALQLVLPRQSDTIPYLN